MTTPAPKLDQGLVRIQGLLIDLDGVVTIGGKLVSGAGAALARLHERIPYRFITNTTRRPRRRVVADLAALGLAVDVDHLYTPAALVRAYCAERALSPFLVTHPDLAEDFDGLPTGGREAVIVGDAGEFFTYAQMNAAFRRLMHGADFLALAANRAFQDGDGDLSLDAGPFVAALEFASRRKATVFGKPARAFFDAAVAGLGLPPGAVAMIGDDVEADVGGAMAAGLAGVLVRTGKYRAGHETALAMPPTLVADDLTAAVDAILASFRASGDRSAS
ncbi:MAG: TIGR01458 family HAD-type hydrolase [Methylobacteriaceae bacterium]|nr:TIGR01458 family HAD-type hydrolase [Methylobacteriaceae bacterium]